MFESLEIEEARARAQMPIAEIIYKIREWDRSWDDYFAKGIRPPNLTDFIDQLSKEFEVKKE